MKNILLVEDDPGITGLLNLHLNGPAFRLNTCERGAEAIERLSKEQYNLVILDIMLPDVNGMEVCRQVRKADSSIPIIMLTSRSDECDKVLALELGADDYITKPFGVLELVARTKAVLRRAESAGTSVLQQESEIRAGDLCMNKEMHQAFFNGERLDLTVKEFDLLFLLASNPGKTFSRRQILELVWGCSFPGYEHTVTSHINRLRIKIEPDITTPKYILTTWGMGYRYKE
ncbi:MAG TPA: response regulator transcription factor [Chitinophagaceae bacterium]|nr:response regulator transcription factor [Chitinophagaceae bacterium]